MKKLIAGLILLASTRADAAIVSFDQFVSGGDVSIARINSAHNTLYIDHNGNITTANILDDTLTEPDFADAINPRVRDFEFLGDFTYTGMLPVTSANLTSDISAGTSYVNGYRIVTSATSRTYTATRDTWVYIDQNGAFQFSEVAVGAAQPTTPANSLLLATVTTTGTLISAVTDRRQTIPPNLRILNDYRSGLNVRYGAAGIISVGAGEIEFGVSATSGRRRNTSSYNAAIATELDTGSEAASTMYYLWAIPDPDNTSNLEVRFSTSSSDLTGFTNERLIGWAFNDASSNFNDSSASNIGGVNAGGTKNVTFVHSDLTHNHTGVAVTPLIGTSMDVNITGARPVIVTFNAGIGGAGGQGQDFWITLDGVAEELSKRSTLTDAAGRPGSVSITYAVPINRWGPGRHSIGVNTAASNAAWTNTVLSRDLVFIEF